MFYTKEELELADKWFEINKLRSDIQLDIYSYIEGLREGLKLTLQRTKIITK